jgi:hypothetical protein
MIQYNKAYSINNGQDSILFKEGKGNTVTGEYQGGTLTGAMEGNILKATYHNQKNNSVGLIEITFHENGFNAKWKQGLEPGPMRGKWKGFLNNAENNEKSKVIAIEIYGIGGEIVVGDSSVYGSKFDDAFDDTDLDIDEIMLDDNTRTRFNLPEWFEIDNLLHIHGPFADEDCIIKISEADLTIFNCNPSDLEHSNGEQIMELEEFYLETDGETIFTGFSIEKGCLFSAKVFLNQNEKFEINKLKIYSKDIMVNDETIAICIHKIEYDNEEIENNDFSSITKEIKIQLHS